MNQPQPIKMPKRPKYPRRVQLTDNDIGILEPIARWAVRQKAWIANQPQYLDPKVTEKKARKIHRLDICKRFGTAFSIIFLKDCQGKFKYDYCAVPLAFTQDAAIDGRSIRSWNPIILRAGTLITSSVMFLMFAPLRPRPPRAIAAADDRLQREQTPTPRPRPVVGISGAVPPSNSRPIPEIKANPQAPPEWLLKKDATSAKAGQPMGPPPRPQPVVKPMAPPVSAFTGEKPKTNGVMPPPTQPPTATQPLGNGFLQVPGGPKRMKRLPGAQPLIRSQQKVAVQASASNQSVPPGSIQTIAQPATSESKPSPKQPILSGAQTIKQPLPNGEMRAIQLPGPTTQPSGRGQPVQRGQRLIRGRQLLPGQQSMQRPNAAQGQGPVRGQTLMRGRGLVRGQHSARGQRLVRRQRPINGQSATTGVQQKTLPAFDASTTPSATQAETKTPLPNEILSSLTQTKDKLIVAKGVGPSTKELQSLPMPPEQRARHPDIRQSKKRLAQSMLEFAATLPEPKKPRYRRVLDVKVTVTAPSDEQSNKSAPPSGTQAAASASSDAQVTQQTAPTATQPTTVPSAPMSTEAVPQTLSKAPQVSMTGPPSASQPANPTTNGVSTAPPAATQS